MTTKPVYQTNQDGLFLYETVANELALSPGAYNIPYGAQLEAPPETLAGKVARWEGEQWKLVEDHRQVPLFVVATGEPYTIAGLVEVAGKPTSYPGWGPLPAWLTQTQSQV